MAAITRFAPFDEAWDDLVRGFFVRPMSFDGGQAAVPAPFRVDVAENETAYVVHADLPGVKKDDIGVTIDGEAVTISAEVRQEKEAKDGERVLRAERRYGKLERAFALGQPVDEATASAKYEDGVLTLTLPKKVAASAKRLSIQ